jgi:hypothetical protein
LPASGGISDRRIQRVSFRGAHEGNSPLDERDCAEDPTLKIASKLSVL